MSELNISHFGKKIRFDVFTPQKISAVDMQQILKRRKGGNLPANGRRQAKRIWARLPKYIASSMSKIEGDKEHPRS